MKRTIILFSLLLLSLFACKSSKSLISEKAELKHSNRIVNAQSGYEVREMYKNSIKYNYELNRKLDTAAIRTFDKKFIANEGYKVGTKWKDIDKKLTDSVYKLSGFGYYVELESGWNLVFCIGTTCTDNFPEENAEVVCIEKRMRDRVKDKNLLFKK